MVVVDQLAERHRMQSLPFGTRRNHVGAACCGGIQNFTAISVFLRPDIRRIEGLLPLIIGRFGAIGSPRSPPCDLSKCTFFVSHSPKGSPMRSSIFGCALLSTPSFSSCFIRLVRSRHCYRLAKVTATSHVDASGNALCGFWFVIALSF